MLTSQSAEISAATRQRVVESYGKLPLLFEANRGQASEEIHFLARGSGGTIFLTETGATVDLRRFSKQTAPESLTRSTWPEEIFKPFGLLASPESPVARGAPVLLNIELVGASHAKQVVGLEEQPGKINYFIGNAPEKWRTNVSTYARVKYEKVYPGVDLIYYGNQRQLEYDFVVAPDADPTVITLEFEGAKKLEVDSQGDLVLHTVGGEMRQRRPLVYQEVDGVRQEIPGSYVLRSGRTLQASHLTPHVGFEVAAYDTTKPLVIDPVLSYSTYLGGSGSDFAFAIAVDSSGNAYLTGQTFSSNFPTVNSLDGSNLGDDAFVAKLNAAGTGLVYSTYLGGDNSTDSATGIAVDAFGNAYVTGFAGTTFPTTAGALQNAFGGGVWDAFVAKLNASGSALLYSTFLGGSNIDFGFGLAIDSAGAAFVTGRTSSANFPITASAFDSSLSPNDDFSIPSDAFIAKLDLTGQGLAYATYLGGTGRDVAFRIAVDSLDNAYVTGFTSSINFPTANAFQPVFGGGACDAFVTMVNTAGSALVYSTYLGGSGGDLGLGIAVSAAGDTYVTGPTTSTDFPTASPFQTTLGGPADAFVTKFNAAGSGLVYSTYLGGSGTDLGLGITVSAIGNAYVTGQTFSSDFPTANPFQSTLGGPADAFVTKFNAAGSALVYSTYLGGSGQENAGMEFFVIGIAVNAAGIAVDAAGNAYVAGQTFSTDFPTANPLQPNLGGGIDAFVAMITDTAADVAITFVGSNLPLPNPNAPLQVLATVANTGSVDLASVDVRIFLDLNSNLLLDVGEPFALTTVTNLLVGTSQNVAGVFQCPPPGSYLGVAKADPLNLLAETNEGNNVGSTPVNMTLPDLTVTGLSSSSTLMNNGNLQVTLQATIANIGQSPTGNVQVRFAFSTNGGVSFTNIGGPVSAGTIPVGGTGTGTRVWNNVAAGAYLIRVTVDPNNLICESNEGNNVSTFNISVL